MHTSFFLFTFVKSKRNALLGPIFYLISSMKDRIRQIMESQHMTQQVFADYIGTTPATLSGIYNDRNRPTLNIVEAIKKKFPDISTDWLIFGSGSMKLQEPAPAANQPQPATATPGVNNFSTEQILDFGSYSAPTPQPDPQPQRFYNGVRNTRSDGTREDVKNIDKPNRHVTEIRVYYSDQTWESFVPSKK